MTMTPDTFAAGAALGFTLGITPGPVVAEILRRGTTGGLRPAAGVAAGAAVGNLVVAGLALAGTGALLAAPLVARAVGIVGAAWIAFLAVDSWRQAGRVADEGPGQEKARSACPGWVSGILLVVANPVVWAFWLATMAASGAPARVAFALGFVAGITASDVALAVVSSRGGRWLGPRGQALSLRLCAVLLLGFALWSVARLW